MSFIEERRMKETERKDSGYARVLTTHQITVFRCVLIILNQKLLGTSIFICVCVCVWVCVCWLVCCVLGRAYGSHQVRRLFASRKKIPRNITLFLLKRFQIIASSNQSYKNKLNFIKWRSGPFGVDYYVRPYPVITGMLAIIILCDAIS